MKKLMKVVSMAMVGLFALVPILNVEAKTEFTATDWIIDGGDGRGTVTAIDDNITNIKGDETESSPGMYYGPYSTKSEAKLADGITEDVYIELNNDNMTHGELFALTMSLNDAEKNYVTELLVNTQKVNDEYLITVGLDPNFSATISEDGVYTYRYTATLEDGKTYLQFSVLKWDEVIASTEKIDMGETTAESVRRVWFCGISAANGINVYTTLPEKPTDPEIPVTPVEPETPAEEVKNEEENPETSDGILLFLGLTVVGFAGVALTYRRLHN